MRYRLPSDRLINQLVPHYLPGRRLILFAQSLVWPLKTLNDRFVEFTREKLIEARMTSQILYFEWFLNRRFAKYFADLKERIYIKESTIMGVDLYHQSATSIKPYTLWYQNETTTAVNPLEMPRQMYHLTEEKAINRVSFMVCVPEITIDEKEFVYMLSYIVNIYRIAGKTYLIKIEGRELEPNNTYKR